jgi:hypothetical protein
MSSEFKPFAAAVHARLESMSTATEFYKVNCSDIFDRYLRAFPAGTNPIFRERTEHDCQCCKQFIRNLGLLVTIENGQINTVWGGLGELPAPYDVVAATMHAIVKNSEIESVFRRKEASFGVEKNRDSKADITWHHFYGKTPRKAICNSPGEEIGRIASCFSVFKRGLEELRQSDLDEILDLIEQNSLYRGEEHKKAVTEFRSLQRKYAQATNKDLFVWENINSPAARFRNTVIGTLAVDLADGVELEKAVKSFESKVAPANYKRPKALITPRMIEQAVATLKELDLEDSINRRFACIEDISVNDIIFVDNTVASKTKDGITDLLMQEVRHTKEFKGGQEIGIEEFIAMRSKKIDLILESRHTGNFVSITAPVNPDSPSLFKWDNSFGWAYDGDVADSIKERVKKAGGNVNAKLRCSLAWFNHDDLDIHAEDPLGRHIYYGQKQGVLDVDMNAGFRMSREPVENLSWTSITDGEYKISVHNFFKRESQDAGFQLQVEFEKQIHEFAFNRAVGQGERIDCLVLKVENGKLVSITTGNGITGNAAISIEKWGVKTKMPTKVNMMMLSPNHWELSSKTGNKHYFFLLDGCLNPEPARGIFNEFLVSSLEPHRKVFEVLGGKTKCQPSNNQLSGVGFSSTRSDSVNVIADGRPFTIKF